LPAIAAALGANDERRVRGLIGAVLAVYGVSSAVIGLTLATCTGPFIAWSKAPVEPSTAAAFITVTCVSHVLTQLSLAITTILKAAGRYALVTAVTTPLTLVYGMAACVLVPLFPSLTTVAILGLASAVACLSVTLAAAFRAIPAIRRPLLGIADLPSLARYGFWLVLTHSVGALTGGVDELVITGTCGAAVVAPWSIGKRLWVTAHTFLAQHAEHLIPTLSSLRQTSCDAVDRMVMAMHWYVTLLAAVGYTVMASCGELIVGAVAGADVALLCKPSIYAYSLLGIGYAVVIIPVISAMAEGSSRPAFFVALLSNTAQIAVVVALARSVGAPTVYYAPVVALPALILSTGTTQTRLFDARTAWLRMKAVLVPMIMGVAGIAISVKIPADVSVSQRLAAGGVLAASVFAATIGLERSLAVNAVFHHQLRRVVRHALDIVLAAMHRVRAAARHRNPVKSKKVTS
jgi:hypothetical protein